MEREKQGEMARKNKETEMTYDTEALNRIDNVIVACPFNSAVDCLAKDNKDTWVCSHRGWNPEEAHRRHQEQKMFMVTD